MGLRGIPEERSGSTARSRRIFSQTPMEPTVYFCGVPVIRMLEGSLGSSRTNLDDGLDRHRRDRE